MKNNDYALLIVDMQNDFCSPEGSMTRLGANTDRNREVLERLPSFLDDIRKRGIPVVWILQNADIEAASVAKRAQAARMGRMVDSVAREGSWGAELAPPLAVAKTDRSIRKRHYSGFAGTGLDNLLRSLGVNHVLVVGTAANVCVDSTVRDAYQKEYSVTVLRDLVGWTQEHLALSALENLNRYFAEVADSNEVLGRLPKRELS